METNTHHHWGKRVTTPMTFDIQNSTLFMSHEHVTLKMSYLERRVNIKLCCEAASLLTITQETVYETWTLSLTEITENQNDFVPAIWWQNCPLSFFFLDMKSKKKPSFNGHRATISMNDGGGFPCINKVLWLESFAYGHTTLNTPDLVRSRKLSGVGPG